MTTVDDKYLRLVQGLEDIEAAREGLREDVLLVVEKLGDAISELRDEAERIARERNMDTVLHYIQTGTTKEG